MANKLLVIIGAVVSGQDAVCVFQVTLENKNMLSPVITCGRLTGRAQLFLAILPADTLDYACPARSRDWGAL